MHWCIKVKDASVKQSVIDGIKYRDFDMQLDPEGNPVIFWVDTVLSYSEIKDIKGVEDVISGNKACPCGSGEYKYELVDARGIFCAYVCSKCEDEKRKKYRIEIFEDPNYQCDEQVEADY